MLAVVVDKQPLVVFEGKVTGSLAHMLLHADLFDGAMLLAFLDFWQAEYPCCQQPQRLDLLVELRQCLFQLAKTRIHSADQAVLIHHHLAF
ncbi:hypothetical protein D3C78_1465790 [compost metagenome]